MNREILVLLECDDTNTPYRSSLSALTFAREIAKKEDAKITLLAFTTSSDSSLSPLTELGGNLVMTCSAPAPETRLSERCAPWLASVVRARRPLALLGAGTSFGKDLLPRVAGLLDCAFVSECCGFAREPQSLSWERPIYAGNATAFAQTGLLEPVVVSVRYAEFSPAKPDASISSVLERATLPPPSAAAERIRWRSFSAVKSTRPALSEARVIVAGGRPLHGQFMTVLAPLADALHAAIGASRAICDEGHAPNDFQVGQTGKIVAPDLYIAVGISGAAQHVAGIRSSRVIVAINNDPQAAIFAVADFGLVGDLFKLLPELTAALARHQARQDG